MCTDPAPHDMDLASFDLCSELPGGPAVGGERHLPDVARPFHAFHPGAGPERPTRCKILDKPDVRSTKPLSFDKAQRLPVLIESRKSRGTRHLPERVEESGTAVEDGSLAGRDLLHGLLFPGLPFPGLPFPGLPSVGPEPCLLG